MSTHAIGTSDAPAALRAFRYADLVLLALALPLFLLAGLPVAGWGATAAAWLAQRGVRALARRKAEETDDVRAVAGYTVASMILRGWLMALAIFGVGLGVGDAAGLAAAVLSIILFTFFFTGEMIMRPFEAAPPTRRNGPGGPPA